MLKKNEQCIIKGMEKRNDNIHKSEAEEIRLLTLEIKKQL